MVESRRFRATLGREYAKRIGSWHLGRSAGGRNSGTTRAVRLSVPDDDAVLPESPQRPLGAEPIPAVATAGIFDGAGHSVPDRSRRGQTLLRYANTGTDGHRLLLEPRRRHHHGVRLLGRTGRVVHPR